MGGNLSTSDVGISVATSGIGETGDLDRFGGQLTLSKARAQVLCDRLAVDVFLRMVPVAPGRVASAPAPPAVTRLARPWAQNLQKIRQYPQAPWRQLLPTRTLKRKSFGVGLVRALQKHNQTPNTAIETQRQR